MTESELLVVDRADAELVRATAAGHGVRVEEVPTRGLEPVTTVTFALLGAAAAVAAVVGLLERHKGGQVIDLRPGAPRAFYRTRDVVYGLVVLIAADGRVLVEVKEPTDTFATAIEALQRVAVGVDAPQYVEEPAHGVIAGYLRDSMELFVLGHEYGHVIGGHLTGATPRTALLPGEAPEALEYSWRQEHEADIYGSLLSTAAMRTAKRLDPGLSYWGGDLFFSAMDVMDRAVSLLRTGDETRQTLGSHPPADRRRAYLRETLRQRLGPERARPVVSMGELVERVVAALWERTRPAVLAARAAGRGAAPSWRG